MEINKVNYWKLFPLYSIYITKDFNLKIQKLSIFYFTTIV